MNFKAWVWILMIVVSQKPTFRESIPKGYEKASVEEKNRGFMTTNFLVLLIML